MPDGFVEEPSWSERDERDGISKLSQDEQARKKRMLQNEQRYWKQIEHTNEIMRQYRQSIRTNREREH